MKRVLGAILAVAIGFGGAAFAQNAPKHLKNQWDLGYYDASGDATTQLGAAETVAYVRGPADYVLEIGCRQGNEGLFYRLGRRGDDKEFAGVSFKPKVTIRDGGDVRFQRELVQVNFRPRGFYQGPVINDLQRSLQLGDRIVFEEKFNEVFLTFSLIGSNNTIGRLPCS